MWSERRIRGEVREENRGGEVREEDEVQYIIEIVVITTNI